VSDISSASAPITEQVQYPWANSASLPSRTLAQIFDALAFYFDHQEAIDKELGRDREEIISKEFPSGKY